MSGDSRFLSAVIVLPAVENNLSVGADVAGIASTFLATMAWSGIREALVCQSTSIGLPALVY